MPTDLLTPLVIKTKTAGDVVVAIVDAGGVNKAAVSASGAVSVLLTASSAVVGNFRIDQTTPGTTNGVQITGPGASNVNPLFTSLASTSVGAIIGSPSFAQLTAGSAKVGQVAIDQTTPGTTNGVQINAALPTGTNSIGNIATVTTVTAVTSITNALPTGLNSLGTVGLNAGTNIVGNFRIDQTTPGTTNGVQITGPGTSSGNPLFTSSTAPSAGTLKSSGQIISTSVVAANGGTQTLQSPLVTSTKVGSLQQLIVTSSAPMRFDVQTVNASAVATTVFSVFTSGSNLVYEFKTQNALELNTVAGDGVNVRFQVVAANQDPVNAVSAYATFFSAEN